LENKDELCEEYDLKSNELLVRKWRRKNKLGGVSSWEVEIGEEMSSINSKTIARKSFISENSINPICSRLDSKKFFQWRIRNLPYPLTTYSLSIEDEEKIVVRTTNKKYFKILTIPDMQRRGLKLFSNKLQFSHANKTLVIQYEKPNEVLSDHDLLVREFNKMKVAGDGDVDCKQS